MKIKFYKNINSNKIVYEDEAEEYVLEQLGITVTPKGKNGEMTLMQIENIQETVEWYFSGNWIKEEVKED